MADNFHTGERLARPGSRIPNPNGIARVGMLYVKVDRDFCGGTRPWITDSLNVTKSLFCQEGEIVRISAMTGTQEDTDPYVIASQKDVIWLRHNPFDDAKAYGSAGWRAWFIHCFMPIDGVLDFESVEVGQIEGRK